MAHCSGSAGMPGSRRSIGVRYRGALAPGSRTRGLPGSFECACPSPPCVGLVRPAACVHPTQRRRSRVSEPRSASVRPVSGCASRQLDSRIPRAYYVPMAKQQGTRSLVEKFVSELRAVIQMDALEVVRAALGEAAPKRRGPARPRQAAKRGPGRPPKAVARRGRPRKVVARVRRSAADLERTSARAPGLHPVQRRPAARGDRPGAPDGDRRAQAPDPGAAGQRLAPNRRAEARDEVLRRRPQGPGPSEGREKVRRSKAQKAKARKAKRKARKAPAQVHLVTVRPRGRKSVRPKATEGSRSRPSRKPCRPRRRAQRRRARSPVEELTVRASGLETGRPAARCSPPARSSCSCWGP